MYIIKASPPTTITGGHSIGSEVAGGGSLCERRREERERKKSRERVESMGESMSEFDSFVSIRMTTLFSIRSNGEKVQ